LNKETVLLSRSHLRKKELRKLKENSKNIIEVTKEDNKFNGLQFGGDK